MADKKKAPSPPSDDGHSITWKLIFIILIVMMIGGTYTGKEIYRKFNDFFDEDTKAENSDADLSFFASLFPNGVLEVGKRAMNKGELIVRSEPAGMIIGKQPTRVIGEILAGPVEKYEKDWWRMDYENSPDGWVLGENLTAKTVLFSAFNILPITFGILKPFLIFLSILFLVLIFIISLKFSDLKKLKNKQKELIVEQDLAKNRPDDKVSNEDESVNELEIENLPTGDDAPKTENVNNRRWANIQSLINSHSVNDWKQAIIEADIILDEMLEKMGYKGDSLGEKLKKVERSDFLTIDSAWEAHKIRNQIAHKGSDYILSRDEADKAIELYKEVFSEFYFI